MAPDWSKIDPKSRRLAPEEVRTGTPENRVPVRCLGAVFSDPFWSRMAHLVTNLGSRVRPLLSFGSPLGSMWMVCCVFSVTFWLRASVCLNCSVLSTICTVALSLLVEFSRAHWYGSLHNMWKVWDSRCCRYLLDVCVMLLIDGKSPTQQLCGQAGGVRPQPPWHCTCFSTAGRPCVP